MAAAVDAEVAAINADPDRLDALLERQNYRLAFWRTAGRELDYRRFFDIHTLAALRMEDEAVFLDTHELVLEWLDQRRGRRAAHRPPRRAARPRGLPAPPGPGSRRRTPGWWWRRSSSPASASRRRGRWPARPATTSPTGSAACSSTPPARSRSTRPTPPSPARPIDYDEVVYEKKHLVMSEVLSAEINRLTSLAIEVCERHRRYRDYTRHELHETLRELIAAFPVYRTYVVPGPHRRPSPDDTAHVDEAAKLARARRPDLDGELFDFLVDILLGRHRGEVRGRARGPLPAGHRAGDGQGRGGHRLLHLQPAGRPQRGRRRPRPVRCEPGGVPPGQRVHRPPLAGHAAGHLDARHQALRGHPGPHRACCPRSPPASPRRWPMVAAGRPAPGRPVAPRPQRRMAPLPDAGRRLAAVGGTGAWPTWRRRRRRRRSTPAGSTPTRLRRRPAPLRRRDPRRRASSSPPSDAFVGAAGGAGPGQLPGPDAAEADRARRPDIYQGCELWDHSLVDPDNRRPVDFAVRESLLAEAETAAPADVWPERADAGSPSCS